MFERERLDGAWTTNWRGEGIYCDARCCPSRVCLLKFCHSFRKGGFERPAHLRLARARDYVIVMIATNAYTIYICIYYSIYVYIDCVRPVLCVRVVLSVKFLAYVIADAYRFPYIHKHSTNAHANKKTNTR